MGILAAIPVIGIFVFAAIAAIRTGEDDVPIFLVLALACVIISGIVGGIGWFYEADSAIDSNAAIEEVAEKPKITSQGDYDEKDYTWCPNCGNDVYGKPNYCSKCGRQLDWSGE